MEVVKIEAVLATKSAEGELICDGDHEDLRITGYPDDEGADIGEVILHIRNIAIAIGVEDLYRALLPFLKPMPRL